MKYVSVLSHASRRLLKRPALSFAAVLTLGLAIGAGTAVFSVVDGVLLKPLPYPESDRLVHLFRSQPPVTSGPVSRPGFLDLAGRDDLGVRMAGYETGAATLTGTGEAARIALAEVSPAFFDVVGMPAAAGRWLGAADDRPDAPLTAVISRGLAERRFGAVEAALGSTVRVDGEAYAVVGVAPPGFKVPSGTDVWVPARMEQGETGWGSNSVLMIGRLAPGVATGVVRDRLDAVARDWIQARPGMHEGLTFRVIDFRRWAVGRVSDTLWVLMGAVLLVLLVACANVANLIVARVLSRSRELATHAALGANTRALAGLAVAEALVLALAGAVLGVALAAIGTDVLLALAPAGLPRAETVGLDGRVLGFSVGITLLATLVAALMPAWTASRIAPAAVLNSAGRQPGSGRHRWRSALVCAELAVSLVLLVGATLLIGSMQRLSSVNPGFDTANLLTAKVVLPTPAPEGAVDPAPYLEQARLNGDFLDRAVAAAAALPGVESAAAIDAVPLTGNNWNGTIGIVGEDYEPGQAPTVEWRWVTPGYFETMELPLLRGRTFGTADRHDSAPSVLINRTFAEKLLGEGEWIGRRVTAMGSEYEIVGVVGDSLQWSLTSSPSPELYFRMGQAPAPNNSTLVLRTGVAPLTVAEGLASSVAGIDRDVPVYQVRSMDQILVDSMSRQRFATVLMSIFAAAAAVIAAVGLYGVMSYTVSLRTHDIGVRMAIGASRGRVLKGIVGEGLRLAMAGSVLGVGIALVMSGWLASLVFDLSPRDPLLYAAATGLLLIIALVATFLPAWRASRVNPVEALRYE